MKKYKWILILINLVVLFAFFNYSVIKKEEILTDGQLVLLKLAPKDPRSLMQGDYMQLNYEISNLNRGETDSIPKRGFCVITLDNKGVGKKIRLQKDKTPIAKNEYVINYTSRKWRGINIGAESFFFQEGEAEKYEKATYGALKIDDDGNSLLIGLYDKHLSLIE